MVNAVVVGQSMALCSLLVAALGDRVLVREVRRGDLVHLEGDPAETVSFVLEGQLLATAYPIAAWAPQPVAALGPGGLLGDDALGTDATRRASVRALCSTRLAVVYRGDLFDLTQRDERAHQAFTALLVQGTRTIERGVLASSASSVEVRLGRWLLHLEETFRAPGGIDPHLAVTQEDLAALATTRRPTANRILRALQSEGLIEIGRSRLTLCDADGLTRWLDDRDD